MERDIWKNMQEPKKSSVGQRNKIIKCIGRDFDDNWGLDDPTEKSDEVFIDTIHAIENKILSLRENQIRELK